MLRFVFVLLAVCSHSLVFAHSLHLFAQYDGHAVSGKAYYSDMTPAANHYLEIFLDNQASAFSEGQTQEDGKFTIALPTAKQVKVVVQGEEGHLASTIADRIDSRSTESSSTSNELSLIREELAEIKDKIYWRDVMGGVGYILGLFGLWALLKSRSSHKDS